MIYVVSGMARSGTSMMMKVLWKGGIPSYYDKKKERHLRKQHGATAANPGGFFEVSTKEKEGLDFPLQAQGMAIKIMAPWKWFGTMAVNPDGYRIVILLRDPEQIRESIYKINQEYIRTEDSYILDNYKDFFAKGLDIAHNRNDVRSVTVLQYAEILKNPEWELRKLSLVDWPINVRKAAKVVNPKFQTIGV